MKPSATQASTQEAETSKAAGLEFVPVLFFVLGILLAASFLQN